MKNKTPQELFEKMTAQGHGMFKDFSKNESQEMMAQFANSWNTIMTRAMESPDEWVKAVSGFYQNQFDIWLNMFNPNSSSSVQPERGDRRFSGAEWEESPVHNYLKQSYLLSSRWLTDLVNDSTLDDATKKKCDFYTRQFIDAMSPSNFALTNPEVLKETMESKGQNLVAGLENLMQDMEKGQMSITDESAFTLGENLATTEGSVVFQNKLIQLVHFKPLTEKVNECPILIVPPCINKYYILDLSKDNSYVRYCLEQGNDVYIISWKNPDESLGDVTWDEYLSDGTIPAIDVVKAISGAKKINAVSWCIGGTMLATTIAVLAAKRKKPIASATFFTTLLDFSDPGEIGVFIDESQVKQHEHKLAEGGVMPGKQLATTFAMLRANDLIWSYVVNNYLKGKTPPPFDILYWNGDSTNMTAAMYTWYLRNMYLENNLAKPGGVSLCGVKVDLGKIDCPTYFLSAIEDHIAPWKTTFIGTELVKGPVDFVLTGSGHVAGVINPANKNKRSYWVDGELGQGSEHWLQTSKELPGSWWTHWDAWLKSQGGKLIDAPTTLGNQDYLEIEPAPGSFVMAKAV
ncbi:MAG: class I poly(R)-hydroxyalkanoic acid synthase [Cycloclasticus sp.]|nr:class I poly(R)-hydroxyalkanoic acid synthase [Cycloclasticus sp.]MBQ0788996.1 class I poly(R)-hydroxyalkanoic acid synthase [Cycloclasticus sp.]